MFAKLARFNGFGRRQALLSAAKTAYANDNHPGRRPTAVAQRVRRPILVRGWRQVPATGRLECFWHVEPPGAAVAEEPGISWMMKSSESARPDCFGLPKAARSAADPAQPRAADRGFMGTQQCSGWTE
jgi:hypothetical protein